MKSIFYVGWSCVVCCLMLLWMPSNTVAQRCIPANNVCEPNNPVFPACLSPAVGTAGAMNQPYNLTLQLNFARTAPAPANPLGMKEVYVSRLQILGVDNLPAGLKIDIFSGNSADNFNGGVTGNVRPLDNNTPMFACGLITGTPTKNTQLTDSVTLRGRVYVKLMFNGAVQGDEFNPDSIPGLPAPTDPINPIEFNYKIPIGEPASRWLNWTGNSNISTQPFARFTPTSQSGFDDNTHITVLNTLGQIVHQQTGSALVPFEQAPAGIYIVQAHNAKGSVSCKIYK
jgi:hypothetical protein